MRARIGGPKLRAGKPGIGGRRSVRRSGGAAPHQPGAASSLLWWRRPGPTRWSRPRPPRPRRLSSCAAKPMKGASGRSSTLGSGCSPAAARRPTPSSDGPTSEPPPTSATSRRPPASSSGRTRGGPVRKSGRGLPHSKTLTRLRTPAHRRKVLECGSPLPLSGRASDSTGRSLFAPSRLRCSPLAFWPTGYWLLPHPYAPRDGTSLSLGAVRHDAPAARQLRQAVAQFGEGDIDGAGRASAGPPSYFFLRNGDRSFGGDHGSAAVFMWAASRFTTSGFALAMSWVSAGSAARS